MSSIKALTELTKSSVHSQTVLKFYPICIVWKRKNKEISVLKRSGKRVTTFVNDFAKCWLISKILFLTDSELVVTPQLKTTYHMAYRIAPFSVTLSDLELVTPTWRVIKRSEMCDTTCSWHHFNCHSPSHNHSATAEFFLSESIPFCHTLLGV